jgi:hypothetical protein
MKTQASLTAGILAAFGATACCFGPLALVTLGFGGAWAARMERLTPLQPYLIGLTVLFMGFAFHRLYIRHGLRRLPDHGEDGTQAPTRNERRDRSGLPDDPEEMSGGAGVILQSTLTCPHCGFRKEEAMPTDACQYFYECESCHALLKPNPGDCCVFCSFGTVKCPPIQERRSCCS